MANVNKSLKRESKRNKARNGMRVSNRNIFQIAEKIQTRAEEAKKARRGEN
jgi:hypothetical protein